MDTLSPAQRSERMSRVRSKDSRPELLVRSIAHALGYRYRKHRRDLPGQPDLAFIRRRKAVFVHGCFWHRHECAAGQRLPKSRLNFWRAKLERNVERDHANMTRLHDGGWSTLIIWECETRDAPSIEDKLKAFLDA